MTSRSPTTRRREVDITVDRPLHEGTTAIVRATSLSGIANRYVSISPGANSEPEIPDGATISSDSTTSPVDLDQLFNTFDERTRAGLQDFIQGQAAVYTGNTEEARATYKYFAPSLQESQRLFAELTRDQAALSQFLVTGSKVFGAIAERRDDLSALTSNANQAFGAIAAENEAFSQDSAAAAAGDAPGEHDLRQPARRARRPRPAGRRHRRRRPAIWRRSCASCARWPADSVPVFRDLSARAATATARPTTSPTPCAPPRPSAQKAKQGGRAHARRARRLAAPDRRSRAPTRPTCSRVFGKLAGASGYYDFNGHYLRVQPAGGNVFSLQRRHRHARARFRSAPSSTPSARLASARSSAAQARRPSRTPAGRTRPTTRSSTTAASTGSAIPTDVPPGP